jgi:hypothetical protein
MTLGLSKMLVPSVILYDCKQNVNILGFFAENLSF